MHFSIFSNPFISVVVFSDIMLAAVPEPCRLHVFIVDVKRCTFPISNIYYINYIL